MFGFPPRAAHQLVTQELQDLKRRCERLEAQVQLLESQLRQALGDIAKLDPVQLELLRDQALNAIRGIRRREKLQDAPEPTNGPPPPHSTTPPAPHTRPGESQAARRPMTGQQYQRVITWPNGVPQGSIFSSIGRAIGSVARVASNILPGPLGAVANVAGRILAPPSAPRATPGGGLQLAYAGPQVNLSSSGFTASLPSFSLGTGGGGGGSCTTKDGRPRRVRRDGKCYKRPSMNPLNPSAARRAIRRIDGARRMLRSIERQLPKTKSSSSKKRCGCK